MLLSAATIFRFPTSLELGDLQDQLAECKLKPVGPLELSSLGFVSPYGRQSEALTQQHGHALVVTVGGEHKILPPAVVNDLLEKKLAQIEQREGRRPGGRARKQAKDEIVTELLPKAFVKPGRTDALIDTQHGIVVINTTSRKAGEGVVGEIRRALGSFPALPLNAEVAPRAVLTGWVAGDELPEGLSLGGECELRDPADRTVVVKVANMELQGDEIAKHLESGKQVTRLALVLDDRISFVLGEDLVVRKLKFLEGALETLDQGDREDIVAELDARFILSASEFNRLFTLLEKAFKLSSADA